LAIHRAAIRHAQAFEEIQRLKAHSNSERFWRRRCGSKAFGDLVGQTPACGKSSARLTWSRRGRLGAHLGEPAREGMVAYEILAQPAQGQVAGRVNCLPSPRVYETNFSAMPGRFHRERSDRVGRFEARGGFILG